MPSDTATVVIDQLRQFGETRRGWLGVKVQSLTDDLAETYGVKENTGALVAGITADSPAQKAGILEGDIILKFDGKDVTTMRGLPRLVAQTPIGKDVDVEVLRKGQKRITARGRRPPRRGGRAHQGERQGRPQEQGQGQEQGAREAGQHPQAERPGRCSASASPRSPTTCAPSTA